MCNILSLFLALTETIAELADLSQKVKHVDTAGQFEWVDSTLVRAITDGHWCVISNANLCKYVCIYFNACMSVISLTQYVENGQFLNM